jgi:hypothetical protein
MGAGETRHGLSGHFPTSPWPLVAPRHRHPSLLRVALLLLGFSYINDRRRCHFSFSPSLLTSSPTGEIHRHLATAALSIFPKALPCPCASLEPAPSQPHSPQSLGRHRPPQVRQSAATVHLVVASRLHCLSMPAGCSTAFGVSY